MQPQFRPPGPSFSELALEANSLYKIDVFKALAKKYIGKFDIYSIKVYIYIY